jgi:hypothetical protein
MNSSSDMVPGSWFRGVCPYWGPRPRPMGPPRRAPPRPPLDIASTCLCCLNAVLLPHCAGESSAGLPAANEQNPSGRSSDDEQEGGGASASAVAAVSHATGKPPAVRKTGRMLMRGVDVGDRTAPPCTPLKHALRASDDDEDIILCAALTLSKTAPE